MPADGAVGNRRGVDVIVVEGDERHLVLSGHLSYDETPDLRATLLAAVEAPDTEGDDLSLDLGALSLRDPAMLGLFLEVHRRCQRLGRRMVLTNVSPATDRLLRITRLSRVLYREDGPELPRIA